MLTKDFIIRAWSRFPRVQFVWKPSAMPVHPSHNCPKLAGMASMETQQLSIYSDLSQNFRIERQ